MHVDLGCIINSTSMLLCFFLFPVAKCYRFKKIRAFGFNLLILFFGDVISLKEINLRYRHKSQYYFLLLEPNDYCFHFLFSKTLCLVVEWALLYYVLGFY